VHSADAVVLFDDLPVGIPSGDLPDFTERVKVASLDLHLDTARARSRSVTIWTYQCWRNCRRNAAHCRSAHRAVLRSALTPLRTSRSCPRGNFKDAIIGKERHILSRSCSLNAAQIFLNVSAISLIPFSQSVVLSPGGHCSAHGNSASPNCCATLRQRRDFGNGSRLLAHATERGAEPAVMPMAFRACAAAALQEEDCGCAQINERFWPSTSDGGSPRRSPST
jgi:hypothetical protein